MCLLKLFQETHFYTILISLKNKNFIINPISSAVLNLIAEVNSSIY